MSGYDEQSILKQRIWRMQIQNTRAHQVLLLFSLLSLVLLTFFFYQRFSYIDDNLLAGWTVVSISIIAIAAAFNNHLNHQGQQSPKLMELYLWALTAILASIFAAGHILLHGNVAPFGGRGVVNISINLFGLILLFSHMLALICYTDRFRFFCTFVLISTSPLIAYQFTQPANLMLKPHNLLADFYLFFMLFCGYKLHKTRMKSAWLVIRNENLIDYMESSKEQTEHVNTQLEEEMRQRVYIEEKLQESNTHLEEKILERTQDLTAINLQLQSSQQRLEMAHSAGGIGTWDWDITQRKMHSTNIEQIIGYKNDEMDTFLGDMSKIVHPEDYPAVRQAISAHLLNHTDRYEAEFRMRHKYGYWVWVQDMGRVVQRNIKTRFAERMVGVRRNITAEKASDERQKLASTVFQQAAEGIVILDRNMIYVNVNPYYERITGFLKEQLIGKEIFSLHKGPSSNAAIQSKQRIIKSLHTTGRFEGEINVLHKSGDDIPVWLHINPVLDHNQQRTHYIAILNDLTERKKNEQRLSYLSNYDPLTDLPNRHFFKDHLHQFILKSLELNTTFALLRLNIDRFRLLNDLLGTDSADILLKHVAQRLSMYDSRTSMIARLGSDDFAIMLSYTKENEQDIEKYCEKLLEVFSSPFDIRSQEITVTISVGVALCPQHGKQVDTLSNSAENALQEAKRLGGNTIRFASNQVGIQSLERVNLENALRKAISNTEFVVFYQAKLNAVTRQIEGFEALVRWSHPTKGIVPPFQFIGLAEEMGIISALGEFVLDQSCAQIKKWHDAGFRNISVAVNVSAQQLQRGNFIETLDRILATHQIDPRLLELEITETLLMDDPDKVQAILYEIKRRHISIALDDFGTGYSSLSYLGLYPIDVIKIDRSFVIQMIANHEQKAIVRAILAMSKSLKMKVVAEGVETLEQAQFLQDEGCELLQGYLFSKPVPAFEANKLLINSMVQPAAQA